MDSKKKPRKRGLNYYRQVKDTVYKHPKKSTNDFRYQNLLGDLKALSLRHGNDQELGGAVRRLILKNNEREQHKC